MESFQNILVICNPKTKDSEVVERALRILKGKKSTLTIVDVIRLLPTDLLTNFESVKVEELQTAVLEERKKQLNNFVKHFRQKGIEIKAKVFTGQFTPLIIEEVMKNNIDLVMMTAEGAGPIQDQKFGTKSMNLIRNCPCPVWIVKPTKLTKCREILAAVDLSSEGMGGGLNEKIIKFAIDVATIDKAKLHLVHACDLYEEKLLKESPFLPNAEIEKIAHHVWGEHKQTYNDLISKHDFSQVKLEQHYEKGDAVEIITQLANQEKVDLVIMGTVNRSNYKGILMGSTAERVCYQVNSSILALKPEGFESMIHELT
ncbi:MAG: universal stress protein E [Candidatus Omnitrophota bacterium]|jgi:universal stress protein E